MFTWVKWLSWVELGIFSLLIVFWLIPGFDTETMLFGWAHGLGFVVLCIVIWVACGKRAGALHVAGGNAHAGWTGRERDRH